MDRARLDREAVTMSKAEAAESGRAWQTDVWNRMSDVYVHEIDGRFAPVVDALIRRAELLAGDHVLDIGTGTGAAALRSATRVGSGGHVVALDISPAMLGLARSRAAAAGLGNVTSREGGAEAIPADGASFEVVLASLSLMYVIDRALAAREIARVLKPRGRFVAAVWAPAPECDIVLFQEMAARFAGPPPVAGVGPGALGDPSSFLRALAAAGLDCRVERETLGFDFPDFASAWSTLAGVTAARLSAERAEEAKRAVMAAMYPDGDRPRSFRNVTQFISGRRR
jgi:SAM-dependent methyltransferase